MPWIVLLLALPFVALVAQATWLARPQRPGPRPALPVAAPGSPVNLVEYESRVRDDRVAGRGPSSSGGPDAPRTVALVLNAASAVGGAVLSVYVWSAVIEGAAAGWAAWPGLGLIGIGIVIVPAQLLLLLLISSVLSGWSTPEGRRLIMATELIGLALPVFTAVVAKAVVLLQ